MYETQRVLLGHYPTPVEHLAALSRPGTDLWIKRDDLTSPFYGGNKVRKLEYVFGDARACGKTTLVTGGAAGSHHVLATAAYGRRNGFRVRAVLVPQPRTAHAETNLRAELAQGVEAFTSRQSLAPLAMARRMDQGAYFVQVGGSSVLGAMGYVDAARELAAQVRAGKMPMPDLVVVTLGSGGTAAGLVAGFALEQMRTRVLAVSVVDPPQLFAWYTRWLVARCAALAGGGITRNEIALRLEVTTHYLGKGYGYETAEGVRAVPRAANAGITLDATYTAKTFAAALDRVDEGRERVVLYWHTLSSAPLHPLLVGAPATIPSRFEKLLR